MRRLIGPALYILLTVGAVPLAAGPEPDSADRATVAVQRVNAEPLAISEEAAILLVGTALIGIAAAVRRAA